MDDVTDRADRFTALFTTHSPPLLAYAVRRVDTPSDAADVVAETFLVAWRRLDEVPKEPSARPWLFGVARRVLANMRRGERRRLALADRLRAELTGIEPAPEPHDDLIDRAMSALTDDDRELLRLVAWEELGRDEIAVALGISRAAVRVRLHRARQRLAGHLAALEAEPVPVSAQGQNLKRMVMTGHVIGERAIARSGESEA